VSDELTRGQDSSKTKPMTSAPAIASLTLLDASTATAQTEAELAKQL
jgi:hypothetical protein